MWVIPPTLFKQENNNYKIHLNNMACNNITYALTQIDAALCEGNAGGLKELYIGTRDVIDEPTESTMEINGVQGKAVSLKAGSGKFVEYGFRKGAASFTSTLNTDVDNATSYWTTELTAQFKRTEAVKRQAIMALVQNDVYVVAVDNNGIAWLLGKDNAVVANSGSHQTGAQRADANQYEIVLTDESNEAPFPISNWDDVKKDLV